MASYTDTQTYANPWNDFPRHLTARQFHDPYRAIYKCFHTMSQRKWHRFLQELTEYALDIDTINLAIPGYDLFKMHYRMLQLIEACHLLHVRCKKKGVY